MPDSDILLSIYMSFVGVDSHPDREPDLCPGYSPDLPATTRATAWVSRLQLGKGGGGLQPGAPL